MTSGKTDHLHGITLENLLHELVAAYGWKTLSGWVRINCFRSDPSIKSSLKFLRRTPWARAQVEAVFIAYKEGKDNSQITAIIKQMAGFSAKKPATSDTATSNSATSNASKDSKQPAKTGAKVNPWARSR